MKGLLSEKNRYHISKYRYYELKYYCLQYPLWKKAYVSLDNQTPSRELTDGSKSSYISDPTAKIAIAKEFYSKKMKLIDDAVIEADEELSSYILKGVTEGLSYDVMNAKEQIPCSRDTYYDRYRRFFYILSKFKD